MLTIEETRNLIDSNEEYSDEKIAEIRDASQGLVELAFEIYHKDQKIRKDIVSAKKD